MELKIPVLTDGFHVPDSVDVSVRTAPHSMPAPAPAFPAVPPSAPPVPPRIESVPLAAVPGEDLATLCGEFTKRVFQKAGKTPPDALRAYLEGH